MVHHPVATVVAGHHVLILEPDGGPDRAPERDAHSLRPNRGEVEPGIGDSLVSRCDRHLHEPVGAPALLRREAVARRVEIALGGDLRPEPAGIEATDPPDRRLTGDDALPELLTGTATRRDHA